LAKIVTGDLRLNDARMLLRQAGYAVADHEAEADAAHLQAIIDGLCEISSSDALTGLANLRQFRALLEQELDRVARTGAPMSLLLIDCDHFKSVNDTYGHPVGDLVLQSIAHRLREDMRPMDTPCRYGGEEFSLILPNCTPVHAERVAGRIRGSIEQNPLTLADGRSLRVTVSIGVACVAPWRKLERDVLMETADRQLYRAKTGGRNRVAIDAPAEQGVSAPERSALLIEE